MFLKLGWRERSSIESRERCDAHGVDPARPLVLSLHGCVSVSHDDAEAQEVRVKFIRDRGARIAPTPGNTSAYQHHTFDAKGPSYAAVRW